MNFKHYSTALACTLFLTACGGSDDSNDHGSKSDQAPLPNTPTDTPTFEQWMNVYISPYQSNNTLDYEIEMTTFDQGKMYTRYDYTNASNIESSFIVTANGRYESGPEHSTFGKLEGTVRKNANTWSITPYSPIQSTDLSMTLVYKQQDISGKNMAEIVVPHEYLSIKYQSPQIDWMGAKQKAFYEALSNASFPAGSACLQTQTVSNTTEYASLDLNSLNTALQAELKADWTSLLEDKTYRKFTFKDTLAYINVDSYWGIAQYQNQYYNLDYSPKGKEYDIQEELDYLKEDIDAESDPTLKGILQENYKLYESSCDFFNKAASDAIYSYINQHK